ncbi:MAG TPA: ATP-binding protein [Thermoanaerobaculia bacterium]
MSPSIRRMLWGAFIGLVALTIVGVGASIYVLQNDQQQESLIVQKWRPLLDSVRVMDESIVTMVSASRGYLLYGDDAFKQQYDDAVREFDTATTRVREIEKDPRDSNRIEELIKHQKQIKELTDAQMKTRDSSTADDVTVLRRRTPDYAQQITDNVRGEQAGRFAQIEDVRRWLTIALIFIGLLIVGGAAIAVSRIQDRLGDSLVRQVKRTEAMIAGMSDGVLLVDGEGNSVFINPAGQRLLGKSEVGVPIYRQADVYRLRDEHGRLLDPQELPAAQALSTGRLVQDVTVLIARDNAERVAVSMSATPLREDGHTSGVIVTFRDITERRALEEQMQVQAERAQILADAGAFFSSNIDPTWVTQAIAERVAEVLGDWSAVILRTGDAKELSVAAIYHRDMASLGLAWSYIYRQPLAVGEGIIGQVVATGYPSMMTDVPRTIGDLTSPGTYHQSPAKLASLLVLPLRTRRETIGALVIAANDPDRTMSDDKLPLAEFLAERAALAIENAKLYTEQVEARRKVEDLSRLKDEFLSIASHELRTPVTSIKGYTQLAKTLIRENDLATSEEYLDIALDQIDRMSRLILELLDVSRIETGRLEIRREPIQWSGFVRDVVHRHPAGSERKLHVSVPDMEKEVSGDRDRLEQVLGNLLENAAKYSPDGSDISVNVEDRGDQFVTAVCDRGIGIPADELGQVFERFHRGRQVSSTNYGGLGLGLYITKQIVERHGGAIWVDSKERAGTTFYFSLPVVNVAATEEKEPAVSRAG